MTRLVLLVFPLWIIPLIPALPQEKDEKFKGLPTANHALALAKVDSDGLPDSDKIFMRYIWVPPNGTYEEQVEEAQSMGDLLNRLSRTSIITRPVWLYKDRLIVLRYDVRWYAEQQKDLDDWRNIVEEYRFDPTFIQVITPDAITSLSSGQLGDKSLERVYLDNGSVKTEKIDLGVKITDKILRILAPDIDNESYIKLMQNVVSVAPIVSSDYFLIRGSSSIEDKDKDNNLFFILYGGLYYRFLNVPDTMDDLLKQIGLTNIKTAEEFFNKRRSDKRVAMARSGVINGRRPRRIDFQPTPAADVFSQQGFISVTFDLDRTDFDVGMDPIGNLLKTFRQTTFHEALHIAANGTIVGTLWDKDFKRQEKAPDSLVKQHKALDAEWGELAAGLGCWQCHEAYGDKGWKKAPNDVEKLSKTLNLGVLFDLSSRDQLDAQGRIKGLFTGDSEKLLAPARDAYSSAVLEASNHPEGGGWKASKAQNTDVVQLSANRMVETHRRYWYAPITQRVALLEAGFDVPEEKALAVYKALMVLPNGVRENPTIGLLRSGVNVSRYEWNFARHLSTERILLAIKANPKLLEGMK